jgi:hypothetical protein
MTIFGLCIFRYGNGILKQMTLKNFRYRIIPERKNYQYSHNVHMIAYPLLADLS